MKRSIFFTLLFVLTALMIESCTDPDDGGMVDTDITYSSEITDIMTTYCTACHGNTEPSAGLSLTTYAQVREATENGNLLARMNDSANPMPPSGLIASDERDVIQAWIDGGFEE